MPELGVTGGGGQSETIAGGGGQVVTGGGGDGRGRHGLSQAGHIVHETWSFDTAGVLEVASDARGWLTALC